MGIISCRNLEAGIEGEGSKKAQQTPPTKQQLVTVIG
jgi:hypothetical protein